MEQHGKKKFSNLPLTNRRLCEGGKFVQHGDVPWLSTVKSVPLALNCLKIATSSQRRRQRHCRKSSDELPYSGTVEVSRTLGFTDRVSNLTE